jgi:hypothetical protein
MRKFIILDIDNSQNIEELITTLSNYNYATEIYVATRNSTLILSSTLTEKCKIEIINIPSDKDTEPKMRNYVNLYFKSMNYTGILHVISSSITVLTDPTTFLSQLENMMIKLDYSVWFNTYTDKCNFVYNKYLPRLSMLLDNSELSTLNIGSHLLFTSHSNVNWVAYNFDKLPDNLLYFDEDFTVPMYFIIEYLSRRRNTKNKDDLYFMNQYLTVESEAKTFICKDDTRTYSNELMKHDDEMFKTKNINHSPDINLDTVLELTYLKLRKNI